MGKTLTKKDKKDLITLLEFERIMCESYINNATNRMARELAARLKRKKSIFFKLKLCGELPNFSTSDEFQIAGNQAKLKVILRLLKKLRD